MKKFLILTFLMVMSIIFLLPQSAEAYHRVPTQSNTNYCQNSMPSNWKTILTNNYGYDETTDDIYVFCTNNSGRDIAYIFAPKLYILVDGTFGTGQIANMENILALSADINSGHAKYIRQNFFNGQWYNYSTNDSIFTPVTINGTSYRAVNDYDDYAFSTNSYNPLYTSGEGTFDLLNPYNITNFANYPDYLWTPPTQPPGNTHLEASMSGNSGAFTGTQLTTNGIDKFEFDFTSGAGTAYVDYATTTDPNVSYYNAAGYSIGHSTVNGDDEYSTQIIYNFGSGGINRKIYMRVTDGAGYQKVMTVDIKTGVSGTIDFVNDDTLESQKQSLDKPVVCGDLDIPCILSQSLQNLFIPKADDMKAVFDSFSTDTHGIAAIIALPLNAIGTLSTASCSPVNLPLPFVNKTFTIPCMTPIYQANFGTVWTIWQTVFTGAVAYGVAINSIALIKGLKNPDDDKIEVFTL